MKYFLLLLTFCLAACDPPQKEIIAHFSGNAMTINYQITVGQKLTDLEHEQVHRIIQDTFQEIHTIYNKWNPHSELSRLNQLPVGAKAELSPELSKLMEITKEVVLLTNAKFDPTIEPLQQLWKEYLQNGNMPDEKEVREVSGAVGWDNIHFENGTFWKDHPNASLDLGGIAKGYGVDLLTERLAENGYKNLFVEWGGEIRVLGCHPEGRPWRAFISRMGDTNPDHAIAVLDLKDCAIATSGDYLQQWVIEGKTYYHILDPTALRPLISTADSIGSVSVKAQTCALADGLATAALMFDNLEEAVVWMKTVQEIVPQTEFWILTNDQREVHLP